MPCVPAPDRTPIASDPRRCRATHLTAVLLILASGRASAETLDEDAGQYADIVVTAKVTGDRVVPPQVELTGDELLARQPVSVADALRGLSGVSVKTNSRGETIARVRGAEERQTAVFFEGSPFSVPWDGRMDLAILPAALIGNVIVTKGAVPIEYGANAVAGVVDLQARSGAGGESGVTGIAEVGTLGHLRGRGPLHLRGDQCALLAPVSQSTSYGSAGNRLYAVPADDEERLVVSAVARFFPLPGRAVALFQPPCCFRLFRPF